MTGIVQPIGRRLDAVVSLLILRGIDCTCGDPVMLKQILLITTLAALCGQALAETEQEADGHHADKAERHQPQRLVTEDEGEDAHRHHCEDVVEAADRMHEAVEEAGGVAVPGMGKGGSRQGDEKQG